jgi:hypothetical protein
VVVVLGSDPAGQGEVGIRSGVSHMNTTKRISLWAACQEVGGYPQLLFKLARQHGLQIHVKGRARYLNRGDLESLAPHVRNWLDRPRIRRRSKREDAWAARPKS